MHRFLSYALTVACGLLFAGTIANTNPAPPEAVWMAPSPAAAPIEREIVIPAGTLLRLRPLRSFGSDISRIEEPISARLVRTVYVGGREVLPAGSTAYGVVTEARRSGKVKGRARVGVRFTEIAPHGGHRYAMRTRSWVAVAPATKKKDAQTIGNPAAGGAVIGGLVGGKKGAAVGAAAGGGGGTAVVLTTRGKEVRVGPGATLAVRLAQPLTLRVRGS